MSIQIPNVHSSNKSQASARGATVLISSRKDNTYAGIFTVQGTLSFTSPGYPTGNLTIKVDLNDSAKGVFIIKTVEQLDTTGRKTPTVYASGRCTADADGVKTPLCRYWLMMVDNKSSRGVPSKGPAPQGATPDIISFLIYDSTGKRLAYGTGPVMKGDVTVAPSNE